MASALALTLEQSDAFTANKKAESTDDLAFMQGTSVPGAKAREAF
jgi:hypothetical protein